MSHRRPDDDPPEASTAGDGTATAHPGDDDLRPVMADLAHVVHNASNLVLGHVAGIQRGTDDRARLAERVTVIEAALGRITGVVDALRASLDPQYWGPPRALDLDEIVAEAFGSATSEAGRRRIRLHHPPRTDGGAGPSPVVLDGARAAAMLAALLGSELERLGSNGTITVCEEGSDATTARLELVIERDDGLTLHGGETRSVWSWIAGRIGDQFGATLDHLDPARDAMAVPVTPSAPPR